MAAIVLGGAGSSLVVSKPVSAIVSGHQVVRSVGDGTVIQADAGTIGDAAHVLGVSKGAAHPPAQVPIVTYGELVEPSWSWTPNRPVYCDFAGGLTQTFNPAWIYALIVGFATTSTSLFVQLKPPIVLFH